jgi:WD40 repeat protein
LGRVHDEQAREHTAALVVGHDVRVLAVRPVSALRERGASARGRSRAARRRADRAARSFVASGGLDNLCSVYKLDDHLGAETIQFNKVHCELAQHEGYLSCCRFVSDDEIITSSGDCSCILWDVRNRQPKAIFNDHTADVMAVTLLDERGLFISGSCDATAKLWDFRMQLPVARTFPGHESDVDAVTAFPDNNAFATGSDDASCRLFDIRAYREVRSVAARLAGAGSVRSLGPWGVRRFSATPTTRSRAASRPWPSPSRAGGCSPATTTTTPTCGTWRPARAPTPSSTTTTASHRWASPRTALRCAPAPGTAS